MKNKQAHPVVFFCILCLLIACTPKVEEPAALIIDKEQIKKEIQEKENQFAEIYNSGEMKNIGYYAEDAIMYTQNRKPIEGRKAIVDFLSDDIETNTDKIAFTTKEVFVSNDGIMVVEIGYYEVKDSTATPINSGNYMCLFEKRDGQYYCLREMDASDIPFE